MGKHFVFKIHGTEYEGMRMSTGLYSSIIATTGIHKQREFPYLLAENTFKRRNINFDEIRNFRNDLFEAGKIVLTYPLLNYDCSGSKEVIALEKTFTSPQLAVHIATAINLCDDAILRKKGLTIREEDGNPDHIKLTLEKKIIERENNWIYLPNAQSVFDYKTRF